MATASSKTRCATCGKDKVAYECRGYLQNFCLNHLNEHNRELSKQLDVIEDQRNQFRQVLSEQTVDPHKHPFFEQIDQWETQSILRIKQTADDARKSLLEHIHQHMSMIENYFKQLTENIKEIRGEDDFNEINLSELQAKLNELEKQLNQPEDICLRKDSSLIDKISVIVIPSSKHTINVIKKLSYIEPLSIPTNARWQQLGTTIAGGNGKGSHLNQLAHPWRICMDDEETIYIADSENHRIMKWKKGVLNGEVVAGGNGKGNRNDQLNYPSNVILDKINDCLIISDRQNRRVVRCSRQNDISGEIIITDVYCWGLGMDHHGYLYVLDIIKHEVKRWKIGDKNGVLVAGGNGPGDRLNQFNKPVNICIDENESIYVSDYENHRVMKWSKGAKEGIVVAGGRRSGSSLEQLFHPYGIVIDQFETLYVADYYNHRVMRWLKDATEGNVIVGGNGQGKQANQFSYPSDLSFDRQNNLYIVDLMNTRVQKLFIL